MFAEEKSKKRKKDFPWREEEFGGARRSSVGPGAGSGGVVKEGMMQPSAAGRMRAACPTLSVMFETVDDESRGCYSLWLHPQQYVQHPVRSSHNTQQYHPINMTDFEHWNLTSADAIMEGCTDLFNRSTDGSAIIRYGYSRTATGAHNPTHGHMNIWPRPKFGLWSAFDRLYLNILRVTFLTELFSNRITDFTLVQRSTWALRWLMPQCRHIQSNQNEMTYFKTNQQTGILNPKEGGKKRKATVLSLCMAHAWLLLQWSRTYALWILRAAIQNLRANGTSPVHGTGAQIPFFSTSHRCNRWCNN